MAALCELSALTRNAAIYFKPSNHDRHGHVTAGASGCTHNVEVNSHKIYSTISGNGVKGVVASHSLSRFVCRSSEANAILSKDELFKDAAKAGDLNALRELVGSGEVDINLPSPARAGWTALQLGAFYDHSEVISYLLWAGADTEVRNSSGNTALQVISWPQESHEILHAYNNGDYSPQFGGLGAGSWSGRSPKYAEATNKKLKSFFHIKDLYVEFACLKGNVEITRMLLEAGADLDAASNDKGTAYDYAQEWGGDEIVDFLLLWAASQANA